MIVLVALLMGADAPDPVPVRAALERCDRPAMLALSRAEPRRRADFAEAIYREQRAIAAERAALVSTPGATVPSPAGVASLQTARGGLDLRQQQIEDARATERAWRDYYEENRAAFLVGCSDKRRDDGK